MPLTDNISSIINIVEMQRASQPLFPFLAVQFANIIFKCLFTLSILNNILIQLFCYEQH